MLGEETGRVESIARDGTALGGLDSNGIARYYVIWHPDGTPERLPEPPEPYEISEAGPISDNGRYITVGLWDGDTLTSRAAVLDDMTSYELLDLPGSAPIFGSVNSARTVVADFRPKEGPPRRGFVIDARGLRVVTPPRWADRLFLTHVNARGWLGGRVNPEPGFCIAYVSEDGINLTLIESPIPGGESIVLDLDSRGNVIVNGGASIHAWIWRDGVFIDPREHLIDVPPNVVNVYGVQRINDAGQLVTNARLDGGTYVALLLAPVAAAGDITGDCAVDTDDLQQLLADWGPCGPWHCTSDLTGDNEVSTEDLLEVLANWS